ncbi:hypothetical protein CEXT_187291 [Caerostris extrusa]|uniref:Uncharacterized protein n=1 Tax=Caerostris extrusa TaxID=172846 RepID=A0AAV4VRW7_CAEEX|nr:hypothetical protein CEXT_187291 [Caerostris extrusa]
MGGEDTQTFVYVQYVVEGGGAKVVAYCAEVLLGVRVFAQDESRERLTVTSTVTLRFTSIDLCRSEGKK